MAFFDDFLDTGGSGKKTLRRGTDRALAELERFYEGPIKGLQLAPEFYKLLSSPALRNTPLGRSLALQNQLLGEVSAGLGGRAFGARKGGMRGAGVLPPDLANAIGENLTGQLAASGTEGSPAAAITAAMRFSGASEGIRQSRIGQAQSVLGQIGGASILPSASEMLGASAQRAGLAANLQYQSALSQATMERQDRDQFRGLVGSFFDPLGIGPGFGDSSGGGSSGGGGGAAFGGLLGGMFGGGGSTSNARGGAALGGQAGASYGSYGAYNYGGGAASGGQQGGLMGTVGNLLPLLALL